MAQCGEPHIFIVGIRAIRCGELISERSSNKCDVILECQTDISFFGPFKHRYVDENMSIYGKSKNRKVIFFFKS